MNNWLKLKLTECRLNYFGSVSWPVWQKRNWDHTFFSLGSHWCGGIDFCELEMQRDAGRSQIIDIWTLTKWPICLLGVRLNLHFWIYEITSTRNWSFLFSAAATVQHFLLELKRNEPGLLSFEPLCNLLVVLVVNSLDHWNISFLLAYQPTNVIVTELLASIWWTNEKQTTIRRIKLK